MTYAQVLSQLFEMLNVANLGDSDRALAVDPELTWVRPQDPSQDPDKFYGAIHNAIQAIAGDDIIDYWLNTGDVDVNLAIRSPRGPRYKCAECGEHWPCSDSKRTDIPPTIVANHRPTEN